MMFVLAVALFKGMLLVRRMGHKPRAGLADGGGQAKKEDELKCDYRARVTDQERDGGQAKKENQP